MVDLVSISGDGGLCGVKVREVQFHAVEVQLCRFHYFCKKKLHSEFESVVLNMFVRAQRLINLEIPVLVRSLKSSNVELG